MLSSEFKNWDAELLVSSFVLKEASLYDPLFLKWSIEKFLVHLKYRKL